MHYIITDNKKGSTTKTQKKGKSLRPTSHALKLWAEPNIHG